jgi:catechol 2,3-dioxygenase-like lactoylglutathione lyase family enzyme
MNRRGFSHIGLSTLDLDRTREFYEGTLGFKLVVADRITIDEGGRLRHMFFDIGRDQLIGFIEPQGVPGIPADYDPGISRGLGVPAAFYHVAFGAGSPAALAEKRDERRTKGVACHRYRGSRLGPVNLLQRSQWPVARVFLYGAQSHRG